MSLSYSDTGHKYYAEIRGKKYHVPSVTSVLGVLAKPALIPWAVNQAIDLIRPSITPGVEHAESYLEQVYESAKKEASRLKRAAGDVGTEAHTVLERYPDIPTLPDGPVGRCVAGGVAWLESAKPEWKIKEQPIYSRRYRFSGRLDGLAVIAGRLSLVDWKSSKGIYPEYRLQTAAYNAAWEEEHPEDRIEQRVLIHLGKEDGSFTPYIYPRDTLRKDFYAFLCALGLYKRIRELEKESHKSKNQEV